MSTLFKPSRPYPLPANAEIVDRNNKPHVRMRAGGKTVYYPLTADGKQYHKPAAKWAADVRMANGTRKRIRFSPNRDASAVMLADLLKQIEQEKAGVIDRTAIQRKRPLVEHLQDWETSLKASGRSDEYITLKLNRVKTLFEECSFFTTNDLTADRLETYLHELREQQGRSIQTSNDWLQAVRQFTRWMIANSRMERDPFTRLKPGNASLDSRRRRGEFTVDEIRNLLTTVAANSTSFRGISGRDRCMLYRVALGTGFRAAELAALVPSYFELSCNPPVVILPAEFTKNRKSTTQPIADDLAAELRTFLHGRPSKEQIWPGSWSDRSADMLKRDLDAAEIPFKIEGPEGEEIRDFHAMRNCYISNIIRTGADLKQSMTLARHSDPKLTAGRYARTRMVDLVQL